MRLSLKVLLRVLFMTCTINHFSTTHFQFFLSFQKVPNKTGWLKSHLIISNCQVWAWSMAPSSASSASTSASSTRASARWRTTWSARCATSTEITWSFAWAGWAARRTPPQADRCWTVFLTAWRLELELNRFFLKDLKWWCYFQNRWSIWKFLQFCLEHVYSDSATAFGWCWC